MFFSRHIPPSCSYCLHGTPIGDGEVACVRRGITSAGGSCRRFTYDPLRREPEIRRPREGVGLPEALAEDALIL